MLHSVLLTLQTANVVMFSRLGKKFSAMVIYPEKL